MMQTLLPYIALTLLMSIAAGWIGCSPVMPSFIKLSRIGNRLPSLWNIHGFLICLVTIIWYGWMNSSYISVLTQGALVSAGSSFAQMKSISGLFRFSTARADHSEKRR